MSLPRFVVLKSKYNNKYLRYVHEDEFKDNHEGVEPIRDRFLRFFGDEVVSPYAKFEVQRADCGNGLVHLRCCYNNKYWVRRSERHWWIVAAANKPEEDRFKWYCTLFKPVYVNGDAKTIRFLHVQLEHYACLLRFAAPFGDCLFGGSKDHDKDSCDVVTIIDWESLSTMPKPAVLEKYGAMEDDNATLHWKFVDAIAFLTRYCYFDVCGPITFSGTITFTQHAPNAAVNVIVNIEGITPGFYALHVNTYGDISQGPDLTGPIFCNLGNIEADANGVAQKEKLHQQISLIGWGTRKSVVGRTIVVYEASNPNPGSAIAWGVIGYK